MTATGSQLKCHLTKALPWFKSSKNLGQLQSPLWLTFPLPKALSFLCRSKTNTFLFGTYPHSSKSTGMPLLGIPFVLLLPVVHSFLKIQLRQHLQETLTDSCSPLPSLTIPYIEDEWTVLPQGISTSLYLRHYTQLMLLSLHQSISFCYKNI